MKQVLQYPRKGGLSVEECPSPGCRNQGIIVDNRYTLISPGTERAIIELATKSLIAKARARPDLVKQVISKLKSEGLAAALSKVKSRLHSPLPLGYSACGVVAEVGAGVQNFSVGDRVACAGFGYACHAEMIFVPKNLAVHLPTNLGFADGTFATLGAIALWGIRQASVTIGDRVAVIGLGLLGQLTVQILKASGCQVIGADIDQIRLDETARFGADMLVNSEDPQATRAVWHFTGGSGADVVIITAAACSNQPLEFAAAISRDRGRVVVVGDVAMNIPRKPFYEKELTLSLSRSYGPGRYDASYEEKGIDYPLGYVRWTENRNMQSFLELAAAGKIDLKSLITDVYDIEQAHEAFQRIEKEKVLGILLKYPETSGLKPINISRGSATIKHDSARVGFLGAGAFATGVLLPTLKRIEGYELFKLYSPTPYKARFASDQFGFNTAAESEEEIYLDPDIDIVFIATPHSCHASQVMKALQAGKSVFVEKPLCLTTEELSQIAEVYEKSSSVLAVGYNRRHSPCAEGIRGILQQRHNPILFNYVVNAGRLPKDDWRQDDKVGGGRIIGEACHFIDLITYCASSEVNAVRTVAAAQGGGSYSAEDNVVIDLALADGSVGTVTYTALGDTSYPKEMLQVFVDGSVLVLSNFRSLEWYRQGKRKILYRGRMEKGFDETLRQFLALHREGQSPNAAESYFHSALTSILAAQSLRTGRQIDIPAKEHVIEEAVENPLY